LIFWTFRSLPKTFLVTLYPMCVDQPSPIFNRIASVEKKCAILLCALKKVDGGNCFFFEPIFFAPPLLSIFSGKKYIRLKVALYFKSNLRCEKRAEEFPKPMKLCPASSKQGCQILIGTSYQNRKKCTK
jgi:hypothetical protein